MDNDERDYPLSADGLRDYAGAVQATLEKLRLEPDETRHAAADLLTELQDAYREARADRKEALGRAERLMAHKKASDEKLLARIDSLRGELQKSRNEIHERRTATPEYSALRAEVDQWKQAASKNAAQRLAVENQLREMEYRNQDLGACLKEAQTQLSDERPARKAAQDKAFKAEARQEHAERQLAQAMKTVDDLQMQAKQDKLALEKWAKQHARQRAGLDTLREALAAADGARDRKAKPMDDARRNAQDALIRELSATLSLLATAYVAAQQGKQGAG